MSRLFFLAHSLAHVYKRISIPNQLRNPARLNETLVCIAEAFRGWFGGVWGLPRGEGSVFVSTSGVRAGCADPRNRRVLTKTETSPLQPLQTSLLARRNTIAMFTNTHVKVWYFCNFFGMVFLPKREPSSRAENPQWHAKIRANRFRHPRIIRKHARNVFESHGNVVAQRNESGG